MKNRWSNDGALEENQITIILLVHANFICKNGMKINKFERRRKVIYLNLISEYNGLGYAYAQGSIGYRKEKYTLSSVINL